MTRGKPAALVPLDPHGAWWRQGLIWLILAVGLAPNLSWMIESWSASPLDAWGWLYFLLAALWWVLVLNLVQAHTDSLDHAAWPPLVAFAVLGLLGYLIDTRVAMAVGAFGLAWASGWLLLGGVRGLLLLPSLLLGLLSVPTVGHMLERIWAALGAEPIGALALKAIGATAFLLIGAALLWLYQRDRLPQFSVARSSYLVVLVTAAAGLVLAFNPPAFGPPAALAEDHWAFGPWYGAEIPTSPSEQRLFADSRRLSKRLYATRDGKRINVLIVESDDVHDLHAPEYCLSGSGWVLDGRDANDANDARRPLESLALPTRAAGELTGARDRQRLSSVYWFSSASRSTADLAGLRVQSSLAPDEPFTLFMITAIADADADDPPRQTLAEFLKVAPWR